MSGIRRLDDGDGGGPLGAELLLAWLKAARRRHGRALKTLHGFIGTALHSEYADLLRPGVFYLRRPRDVLRPVIDEIASVLDAGIRSGEVRACDSAAAARVALGLTLFSPLVGSTPLSAAGRRRTIEALQDLITYGCVVNRATSPTSEGSQYQRFQPLEAGSRDAILARASYLLNRRPRASMEEIAACLKVSPHTLGLYFGGRGHLVSACHSRTLTIFLHVQDATLPPGPVTAASVRRFVQAMALSYLSPEVQPLSPIAALSGGDVESQARRRLQWTGLWMLLRPRLIDAIGIGELRERHHDLAPRFWLALCSSLPSGLWQEEVQDPDREADGVAELICLGLAPAAREV